MDLCNKGEDMSLQGGDSCLAPRALRGRCEPESQWAEGLLGGAGHKRHSPEDSEEEVQDLDEADGCGGGKRSKPSSPQPHTPDIREAHAPCRRRAVVAGGRGNLIGEIGRDLSINCLLRLSRSEYGSVALLSQDFRSVVRGGEIYRLRRQNNISEHWVYFSCNVLEWDAYDPYRERWISVPKMPPDECFMCSDKESMAVGTELLVFGMAHIVFRYSILTNSWTRGEVMNSPRCLFGSASVGEKAYVAGGTDSRGRILSSAELYNSETHSWMPLPSMNRARKNCSGVFMDGKFYVIGGVTNNNKVLTCGEEYDVQSQSWKVIENMSEGLNGVSGAPPLIAVVKNELYAADYSEKDVKKYDKQNNKWITLGKLPERSVSMNGWGLAFRAFGERLIVIGGPRTSVGGTIELNSWIPDDKPPVWNLIARRQSGNFVYNCAVMGC
ncbi:F-box/kelch-repeat protein SKIP11-like [Phragmites australis]|uniref:F-box/kelch-repeat protein SKIP11-like n=1 Tax=Phragmites australis TaxID=29695 RepID=UPI002D78CB41|nr:F-box/kelch-repeat protein SKIP11-like [Phragmites australis]XP_062200688.1 F-box/kelch-repeat protein SKIP11-like [Phragmites australis]XP_062200689.1 F-box/kelch-repeat protein SKIP11-like [Phragmites australis]